MPHLPRSLAEAGDIRLSLAIRRQQFGSFWGTSRLSPDFLSPDFLPDFLSPDFLSPDFPYLS